MNYHAVKVTGVLSSHMSNFTIPPAEYLYSPKNGKYSIIKGLRHFFIGCQILWLHLKAANP